MRSGTTARAFALRLGSAAPKGLIYDEILIDCWVILIYLFCVKNYASLIY